MKRLLPLAPATLLLVASCETGGPVSSSGFDPLDPAGGSRRSSGFSDNAYRPGEFVEALMDNTAFFKNRPSGNASADKLLSAGTGMKVIQDDGSYVKVELDSGESGFVPSVQVTGQGGAAPSGSEVQVWPPVESTVPLPAADGETPPTDAPMLPPVIDPDAPAELPPLPDDAPTPGLGAEPPLPESAPASDGADIGDMPEPKAPDGDKKEDAAE